MSDKISNPFPPGDKTRSLSMYCLKLRCDGIIDILINIADKSLESFFNGKGTCRKCGNTFSIILKRVKEWRKLKEGPYKDILFCPECWDSRHENCLKGDCTCYCSSFEPKRERVKKMDEERLGR